MKNKRREIKSMETGEIIWQLRRMAVETGSLNCLDCGHEHSCGVHGCAVLMAAANALERGERRGTSTQEDQGLVDRDSFLMRRFMEVR